MDGNSVVMKPIDYGVKLQSLVLYWDASGWLLGGNDALLVFLWWDLYFDKTQDCLCH